MTHTYTIAGMTCKSCVAKVKSALLKLGDITEAEIQLDAPQATITMQKHITTNILQEVVSKAGHYTIAESDVQMKDDVVADSNNYLPIILIFGYITGASLLVQLNKEVFNWMQWMSHFMAGFFLVFSFFKLMNLKGFAEGYASYDVVAKKWLGWGYIYPFVELGLGIAFLLHLSPLIVSIVAFVVMLVSTIGVVQSLIKKNNFQCACLGTVIKLPLSKVTLVEDLLMVAMSAIMIAVLV